eukprot:TRINITY_DN1021_c0_g1::TRINITY_DN1021_c0_g1_i1::g.29865::m.29865 TRINITY_DN1021_c0_g1::TRINITY_DN1021_c0_g1_i1::g.29865  ORF type:complete len:793 (-),score=165.54,sp/Q9Y263/PLAP_HUMAN/33.54/8e-129,WD40/PF00400.27/3.6e-05,WD40/PF00400.27/6.7e-09,WD40/PF00400.27/3.4e-05,WD40/PF00400.27/5.9e-09,WD40/PF00400.27/3.9e-07,WD40/PF00400.27/2.3e-07,WD40/PF00400.27/2.9,PUL/PF08324.6/3.2e-32,PFU/PF09070.6/1.5e-25,BBS2_Mid/PF14783.1/74,BBS2_Mid/PF14783.1/76,BBS2_Mid/PF14783.1/2e+02,BBS2_Mid/PF14783.1/0.021,B
MVYSLSYELRGHSLDVRDVCSLQDGRIVTASKDRRIKIWAPVEGTREFKEEYNLDGHEHYVYALVVIQERNQLVSASQDKTIRIWDLGAPFVGGQTIRGHKDTVCALAVCSNGDIISGSWDSTARVWRNGECIQTLEGHTAAVWCVAQLPDGSIITGSADRTLRRWKDGRTVQQFTGHEDCVRSLRVLPNGQFLSCANDGDVRVWDANTGGCVAVVHAHDQYVYCLDVQPAGLVATASEDRTVRLWQGTEPVQTLMHPAGVWAVSHCPNGDIITACQDGVARVFTQDSQRTAPADILEAYNASVASQQISSKLMGGLDKSKLASVEELSQPGRRDGEQKIVSNGESAEVYLWSQANGRWEKLGDVVSDVTDNTHVIDGVKYDITFPVDLEGETRRIGYNAGQDHYQVAQDFILKEELSQEHLDTIAKFLITNTRQFGPVIPTVSAGTDPWGNSRYVPEGTTTLQYNPAADPFSNRYVPSDMVPSGHQASAAASSSGEVFVPTKQYVLFDTANFDGILKKLNEFQAELRSAGSPQALSDAQLAGVTSFVSSLKAKTVGTTPADLVPTLDQLLLWPADKVFPVLDILRMAILQREFCALYTTTNSATQLVHHVMQIGGFGLGSAPGPVPDPCRLLSLRFLANVIGCGHLGITVTELSGTLIENISSALHTQHAQIRIVHITVVLNMAILMNSQPSVSSSEIRVQCVTAALATMLDAPNDEVQLRALAAGGTACVGPAAAVSEPKRIANDSGVRDVLTQIVSSTTQDKNKLAASQFLQTL